MIAALNLVIGSYFRFLESVVEGIVLIPFACCSNFLLLLCLFLLFIDVHPAVLMSMFDIHHDQTMFKFWNCENQPTAIGIKYQPATKIILTVYCKQLLPFPLLQYELYVPSHYLSSLCGCLESNTGCSMGSVDVVVNGPYFDENKQFFRRKMTRAGKKSLPFPSKTPFFRL